MDSFLEFYDIIVKNCKKMDTDEKKIITCKAHVSTLRDNIKGKTAIITGAGRGIGLSFTKALLNMGVKVGMIDVYGGEEELVTELQSHYGIKNVMYVVCDITYEDQFNYTWDQLSEALGPIDIVINNAGIDDEIKWDATYDVNIKGTTRGTLMAIERMGCHMGGSGGTVINIASMAGLRPLPQAPIYSAASHAIVGLTRSLGHSMHYTTTGVMVKCLCPSFVNTEFLHDRLNTPFTPVIGQMLKDSIKKASVLETDQVCNALKRLLEDRRNGIILALDGETLYSTA